MSEAERIAQLEQQVASLALSSLQKEAKFAVLNLMFVSLLKELAGNGTIDGAKLAAPFSDRSLQFAESAWRQLAFPPDEDPAGFRTDAVTAGNVTKFVDEIINQFVAALVPPQGRS